MKFITRFFEIAFSASQRSQHHIRQWQEEAANMVASCAIFPFSQWFHPVFIAAGCLQWTKSNISKISENKGVKAPQFPETIAGYPWYLYVDPAVDAASVEQIAQAF